MRTKNPLNRLFLLWLSFYQKFISPLSVGSCRYYPSCSEYSKWCFYNLGFFKALWSTSVRILRCNKFFIGGIEYPQGKFLGLKNKAKYVGEYKEIEYWFVEIQGKKDRFLIVKSIKQ